MLNKWLALFCMLSNEITVLVMRWKQSRSEPWHQSHASPLSFLWLTCKNSVTLPVAAFVFGSRARVKKSYRAIFLDSGFTGSSMRLDRICQSEIPLLTKCLQYRTTQASVWTCPELYPQVLIALFCLFAVRPENCCT